MSSFAGIVKVSGGEWTNEEMTLVKDLLFLSICKIFGVFLHSFVSICIHCRTSGRRNKMHLCRKLNGKVMICKTL